MGPRIAVTFSHEIKVQPYLDALQVEDAEPVPVGQEDAVSMEDFDGLLLSGGVDLNPELYGQSRHPAADEPNDARDRLETKLLEEALALDKPILAICRGMQLFNVVHGGTLVQHMDAVKVHQRYDGARSEPVHQVKIEAESKLAMVLGSDSAAVNSRHHQAVALVGAGLAVTAVAADGTVEGLERDDRNFALAVQWHPEDQAATDAVQRRLFRAFVRAARAMNAKA